MKRLLLYSGVLLLAYSLCINHVSAQSAPNISYSPQTNVFTVGTSITSLTPTNTGGTIPSTSSYATVTTYAGSTSSTAGRTNNTGTNARFNTPRWMTLDGSGNMYVADAGNNEIRKIVVSSATVSLLAGSTTGGTGRTNATGTSALFDAPYAVADDGAGDLYVADYTNNEIRKVVESTGAVTLVAGSASGTSGMTNATGTSASFSGPAGIAYDSNSNVFYIADFTNNQIRKMTPAGVVTLFAGSTTGTSGSADGTGSAATFSGPNGIAVDGSGNVYVADQNNNTIRMITPAGVVTTIAGSSSASGSADGQGTAATFLTPRGLCIDISGNIYVSDSGNNLIRMITTSYYVTTVAGSGTAGQVNGTGTATEFNASRGLVADPSTANIYIADYSSNTIRKMTGTGYLIYPSLPAGLSFNASTGVISGTPTAVSSQTTYTVIGLNTYGCSTTTITIQCVQTNNWLGSHSTLWNQANNWSKGTIPTANDAVNIGNGVTFTNQPTISTTNATAYSVTFGTTKTATLTISSGISLTLSGALNVTSTSTPTITGSSTTSVLDMSPGAGIIVSSTTGTKLTLNTLNLLLESSAAGDAYIGQVSSSTFTGTTLSNGNVTVQRYLTGGSLVYRGYRLLSSPVYAATLGTSPNQYNVCSINYLKNSTFITGTTGAAGGFDVGVTSNPSLYLYRESVTTNTGSFTGGNFRGVNKINNTTSYNYNIDLDGGPYNIPVANGYLGFFRGSRSTVNPFSNVTTPLSATLTTTGTLNTGNITVNDWFTAGSPNLSYTAASPYAGYNLVGNPYASAIDWDTFQTSSLASGGIYGTSNVSATIYVLDPISHNFGAYIANSGGTGTNNASHIISSGQGFFVVATGTGAQLTFTESAKTSTQNTGINLLMGKPVNFANNQYLRLKLAKDASNAEDILVNFNNTADNNYNGATDAIYRQGYGSVNFSGISRDNKKVAIHAMPLPKQQQQVLRLFINTSTTGNYTMALKEINAIPRLYDIWLMDSYMKDSVDMRQNPVYIITINKNDTASFGVTRFKLVIRQNRAYAYRLLDFTAAKAPDARRVEVNWNTVNEGNYTNFTVERSTDGGNTYNVIGGVTGTGLGNYGLVDKSPATGMNRYRLKQEDVNNTITYSNIVGVQFSPQSNTLTANNLLVYPNPAANLLNVAVQNQTTGIASYNVRFLNSSGIVVKQFTLQQPTWEGNVSGLEAGTYVIQVLNGKNAALIGQGKFVKM